ncbi:MAG: cyclase family protein [Candidatus Solibacter usitatus]|nr:cyclase family protein [Candidatus Solibacter usitatus]
MSLWIDISTPLVEGIATWPGDPAFRKWLATSIDKGDDANVTAFSMCAHTGTHVDAPLHYFNDGTDAAALSLGAMIGPARVLEGFHGNWQGAERVLFRAGVGMPLSLAQEIAAASVKLVGIDALSVGDDSPEGAEVHRVLLRAGIVLLEVIDLTHVEPGEYELICMPLKLAGSDGAPARAALRRL